MRPILPKETWDEIKRLDDIIIPYMFYTKEKGWAMRPDAPQEVVEARRRIDEIWAEAKKNAM